MRPCAAAGAPRAFVHDPSDKLYLQTSLSSERRTNMLLIFCTPSEFISLLKPLASFSEPWLLF